MGGNAMLEEIFDIVVIGGGPAGYVAAIHAADLGLSVTLVEKEKLGGVCLNVGCIPSKFLIDRAEELEHWSRWVERGVFEGKGDPWRSWVSFKKMRQHNLKVIEQLRKGIRALLTTRKVHLVSGVGRIVSIKNPKIVDAHIDGVREEVKARNIIIATGARAYTLPHHAYDGVGVLTNKEILFLEERPEHLAIIGGGVVGLEMAYAFRSFGSEITVIEFQNKLLAKEDQELVGLLQRYFEDILGIRIVLNADVQDIKFQERVATLRVLDRTTQEITELTDIDLVLLATGIRPNVEELGLKTAGVATDRRGFIEVNPQTYETNVPGVYAIGDVNGRSGLAHVASKEGEIVAELIAGRSPSPLNPELVTSCIFTVPRIAGFGLKEEQAKERYETCDIRTGKVSFSNIGRGIMRETVGLAKVVVDYCHGGGVILGARVIGEEADSLVHLLAAIAACEGNLESALRVIYTHPTFGEIVKEILMDIEGMAIHKHPRKKL